MNFKGNIHQIFNEITLNKKLLIDLNYSLFNQYLIKITFKYKYSLYHN